MQGNASPEVSVCARDNPDSRRQHAQKPAHDAVLGAQGVSCHDRPTIQLVRLRTEFRDPWDTRFRWATPRWTTSKEWR
jgi:hypothetical protein